MLAGNDTDPQVLNFTYDCVKFNELYMDFQMNYSFVDEISIRDYKDRLKVYFYGP